MSFPRGCCFFFLLGFLLCSCKESGTLPKTCLPKVAAKDAKLRKHGKEWICYSNKKWKRALTFYKGKPHGILQSWHPNGKKKIETYFSFGRLHGNYQTWYRSGHRFEMGKYQQGKREGQWIEYYRNGKVKIITTFKNNLLDGLKLEKRKNGNVVVKGFYSKGSKCGKWECHDGRCQLGLHDDNNKCKKDKQKSFIQCPPCPK